LTVRGYDVTSIGENAFMGSKVARIVFPPEWLMHIQKGAFSQCKELRSIVLIDGDYLPIFETSSFSPFEAYHFENVEVILPNVDKAKIQNNYVFQDYWSLFKNVTWSDIKPDGTYQFFAENKDGVNFSYYRDYQGRYFLGYYTNPRNTTNWAYLTYSNAINPDYEGTIELSTYIHWKLRVDNVFSGDVFNGCRISKIIDNAMNCISTYMAFKDCPNLMDFEVDDKDDNTPYKSVDGIIYMDNTIFTRYPTGREGHYDIPENVTRIWENAFRNCQKLTEVNIPSSVTSIGSYAFEGCVSLKNIDIPSTITSIPRGMFSGCSKLEEVNLPSSITEIGFSPFSRSGLKTLVILATTPPEATHAFESEHYNDVTVYVPVGTKALYQAAEGWSKFQNIVEQGSPELKVGDTFTVLTKEGVTMTFMVTDAEKKTCQVGDNNTASIDVATNGNVTIPEIANGYMVTGIGDKAFYNCEYLVRIWLHEKIEYIGDFAFYGCNRITTIDIPHSVVKIRPRAFEDCGGNAGVTLNVPSTRTSVVGELSSNVTVNVTKPTKKQAQEYVEPRVFVPYLVKTLGAQAYSFMESVVSMVVDERNTVYDSRNQCNAIIRTEDNTLLFGCQHTNIPESVTAINDWAFEGHTKRDRIELPSSLTQIGEGAFSGCVNLRTVTSFVTLPFAINDNTFDEDTYKQGILKVPYGTKSDYASTAGWRNFYNIEEMPQIVVESNDENPEISGQTYGVWNEEEVGYLAILLSAKDAEETCDIPMSGVHLLGEVPEPIKVIAIGQSAFENNQNVKTIKIPGTVLVIEDYAFAYCSNLEAIYVYCIANPRYGPFTSEIVVPNKGVRTRGEASEHAQKALEGLDLDKITLYVPYGCKEVYEAADGWSLFRNIVEMEDTGISGVLNDNGSKAVFDLQGRKVRSSCESLEGLPKGVYIINGRKVVK
jgi:hypothetical protein